MRCDAPSIRRAYAPGICGRIAPADATDVRTDALTKKNSPAEEISRNASRAGGLSNLFGLSERGATRRRGEGHETARAHDPENPNNCGQPPVGVLFFSPAKPALSMHLTTLECLGLSRSTPRKLNTCRNNTADPSRPSALVGTQRHRNVIVAACSPVARWHGRSDGSNPLRPPTNISAADRCEGSIVPIFIVAVRKPIARTTRRAGVTADAIAANHPEEQE